MTEDQIYRSLLSISVNAFVGVGNAVPSKYFAVGPYRAEQVGRSWWGVMNKNGLNVLTFPEKPGAVVTDEANAKRIADEWNARTEPFEYPHVPPATPQELNDDITVYIRSRVYDWERKTWSLRRFYHPSEVYDASFALPLHEVDQNTRTWAYRDRVFTTPATAPIEKIFLAGVEQDALPMGLLERQWYETV
jgi:hypothetical protein